jgi:hypothetical protein
MRSSLAWLVPVALVLAGCHYSAVSTAGVAFPSDEYDNPFVAAARASGVKDLNCPSKFVRVTTLTEYRVHDDFVVDGCGQRAVYRCAPGSLTQTCPMLLMSRFAREPS